MPLGRRGPLSKIIGGGIGLTQEYKADRQKRKEAEQDQAGASSHDENTHNDEDNDEDDEEDDDEENDEELVQHLDAAQLELVSSNESGASSFDEGSFVDAFIRNHPPPPYSQQQPTGVLSTPVIIPQRRPGAKSCGFVRAYAPVLQDAGIDQDTWMELLGGFEKSIGQNKWFHVTNAAVWVAGKVRLAVEGVSIIARFVTMAIHLSIEGGRRAFMNSKTNTYIDRMNEDFFKPRGLYALLITYKPKSNDVELDMDVENNIVGLVGKRDEENRARWKNLLSSTAGKTTHEEEIPEFAPLVFPQLDDLNEQQKQNAVKQFGSFLSEYMDRKSQAKFDGVHENSKLAGVHPEHQFASRYSDPNNPASQGGLVSTITGGNYQYTGPLQRLTDRRNARRSKFGISRQAGAEGRTQRRNKRPIRRFLTPDAIYLMVVNYPSKEEQEAVLEELEQAKIEQKGQQQWDINAIRKTLGLQGLGRRA